MIIQNFTLWKLRLKNSVGDKENVISRIGLFQIWLRIHSVLRWESNLGLSPGKEKKSICMILIFMVCVKYLLGIEWSDCYLLRELLQKQTGSSQRYHNISPLAELCVYAQSCVALCNSVNCSLPGFSVHGIFQARKLEWVAVSYSMEFSQPRIEPISIVSPALAGGFFTMEPPGKSFRSSLLMRMLGENYRKVQLPGWSFPVITYPFSGF